MRAIARIHGEISMILQLNGQLTPAYKHFQRVALHNPGMTLVEYLAIQRGYRIYVKEYQYA